MSKPKAKTSRRKFLKNSGKTTAGLAVPYMLTSNALGNADTPPASERLRVGQIGLWTMGKNNLHRQMKNTVALCDVDKNHLAEAHALVKKQTGRECDTYNDYRKLLERKDIDAVCVSTPDHWHAIISIHACQAGKHVYCEKPLSHTIEEGRAMVKAARHYQRVVQTGSHQRSSPHFRKVCQFIRDGGLGKVHTVKVGLPYILARRKPVPDSNPPPQLDYNFWLGPAPKRQYNEYRVHFNFRYFWDYAGGILTDWGAHYLDVVHWGLGLDHGGPILAMGMGQDAKNGIFETPAIYMLHYKYPNDVDCFVGPIFSFKFGATFIGTKGSIYVERSKLIVDPPDLMPEEQRPQPYQFGRDTNAHHKSWTDCIKNGGNPTADVEIGHRSATACHLGNIALRTRSAVKWDAKNEKIIGNPNAEKLITRPYRNPWKLPKV
ncbi:MAG: Gfo/Idh/MocA family protein [Planctomycetota bacterium]